MTDTDIRAIDLIEGEDEVEDAEIAETDPQAMRAELIQVAAVVVRIVAQIDRGQR